MYQTWKSAAKKLKTEHSSPLLGSSKASGDHNEDIDEDLYSRQLYVLGHDTMRLMGQADILISGLGGLGVEIAKNVILSGVKSVTLHDESLCQMSDLSSQFYLTDLDIRKNRAEACLSQLAELNAYVYTQAYTEPLTIDFIKQFKVVVLTETGITDQLWISEVTRANDIALVIGDTRGLFGQVFCDFGKEFTVVDTNGEPPASALIVNISRDSDGIVTCVDDVQHGLQDGDYVTFSEVVGMTELNGCDPKRIQVLGPYSFKIGDCSGYSDYVSDGIVTQLKIPKVIHFKPLSESLKSPEFVMTDSAKSDRPAKLHLAFNTLHNFVARYRRFPKPWNTIDACAFLTMAKSSGIAENCDSDLLKTFVKISSGSLGPMNSVIGGIVAQEVMKACSGKFNPIFQWLYFDAIECLPDLMTVWEGECQPTDCRYDGQTAVFGNDFQQRLEKLHYFVVGAGALGCELLKNFAMMGVGASDEGRVTVTDMDFISKSNLSTQFLYRASDVDVLKSTIAVEAAWRMNTAMNIIADGNRFCPATENIYDQKFFMKLDGVANAVDTVEDRRYVDEMCVLYQKVLLDSGILGTKGSTQVVIPFLTESYNSSQDPQEKSIPVCTLTDYPNSVEHTLQWARNQFDHLFKTSVENSAHYLSNSSLFMNVLEKKPLSLQLENLRTLKQALLDERPLVFQDCIAWARRYFQDQFYNQIRQLLFNCPADQLTEHGTRFWSGLKRCPVPLTFNVADPLHFNFITAAANLKARVYGITEVSNRQVIKMMLEGVSVEPFTPCDRANSSETVEQLNRSEEVALLRLDLWSRIRLSGLQITPQHFEKDDNTKLHMDFIVAASSLRASNYNIPQVDRFKSTMFVGKIIPAIATASSVAAGLVCLELYKLIQGHRDISLYKNGYFNLALPFFCSSEPLPAVKQTICIYREWSLWNRCFVEGELTLADFCDYFMQNHGLTVTKVLHDDSVIYATWVPKEKLEIRMKMTMSELVNVMSRKKIAQHPNALDFQIVGHYVDRPEVEVPFPIVRYNIPNNSCES